MADRVLPVARKLIVCNDAAYSMIDDKAGVWRWQLTDVMSVAMFPPGISGDFDVERLWIYAQFTDAAGEFDLCVRMQRVRLQHGKEIIDEPIKQTSELARIDFADFPRLDTRDFAFEWLQVPFDTPGIFRFSVWSNYVQLPGATAELVVLDEKSSL